MTHVNTVKPIFSSLLFQLMEQFVYELVTTMKKGLEPMRTELCNLRSIFNKITKLKLPIFANIHVLFMLQSVFPFLM